MSLILYSGVDVLFYEHSKEFVINPKGERFYGIAMEERSMVFEDATITRNDEGKLEVEGAQPLFTEHKGSGRSYEKMVSMYPAELIRRRSFMGMVWYSVHGSMTRRVRVRYCCRHSEYACIERKAFISYSFKGE